MTIQELGSRLRKHLKSKVKDNQGLCDGFLAFFVILFNQAHFDRHVAENGKFDVGAFLSFLRNKDTEIWEFLQIFRHSQMFERFCDAQVNAPLHILASSIFDRTMFLHPCIVRHFGQSKPLTTFVGGES